MLKPNILQYRCNISGCSNISFYFLNLFNFLRVDFFFFFSNFRSPNKFGQLETNFRITQSFGLWSSEAPDLVYYTIYLHLKPTKVFLEWCCVPLLLVLSCSKLSKSSWSLAGLDLAACCCHHDREKTRTADEKPSLG